MRRTADRIQSSLFDNRDSASLEQGAQFGVRRRNLEGVLPSGSLTMDVAMGVGGLPRGRIVELFGGPSAGKTTLGLQAIAAVQRGGDTAAFLDAEHAFDASYAARVGVDIGALLFTPSADGEQAFRIMEKLAASKAVDFIVVDSVAALLPPGERDAAVGQSHPFGQCEMLASGLRRLSRAMTGSPCCVLLLNQVRAYSGFGYDETSSGGWAVKLHATIRADLREKRALPSGKRVQVRVVKNLLAAPLQREFDFADGVGVSPEAELIDRGLEAGVLSRHGSTLTFQGGALGGSREEAIDRVRRDQALAAEIGVELRLALGLSQRKPIRRAAEAQDAAQAAIG